MKAILGRKLGMSQVFGDQGEATPVTVIEAGPCRVLAMRTEEKDGYAAVQLGFGERKERKSMRRTPFAHIREFRGESDENIGDSVDVSVFEEGETVKVSGVSKGKGFQGAVKRHGFSGRDRTHGVKHEHRTLGSIGATGPQRVLKGKKMPGRMGTERVTTRNLKVVKVDAERNLLAVKGAVPGPAGSLVEIRA